MRILGFDPGRDKCGVAVMDSGGKVYTHQVVTAEKAIALLESLYQQYSIERFVMGNQTTAKSWQAKIENSLPRALEIILIDERDSSLEARDRYWEMFPPKGLQKFIPQGMRVPDCPIDDIVAILLIERYLKREGRSIPSI